MLVAQTASTSPSFALLICCGCPLTCSRFFEHYSASLPIIDPTLSPDQCYSQSPFLFWAIVCIGSRRYPDDPTLLGWLAPRINSLALSSLSSRTTPIQKIQGLLLLCTWPIPINTMSKDITNILSGAALHLALQIGLHVLGVGQDFERNKVDADETEKIFRARLWLQCLKTCQRYQLSFEAY
jgi:transcriptional regulatory protein LEU3